MSRALSWKERRRRLVEKAHQRVGSARTRLRASGVRIVPTFARFRFLCGHVGCSKPFGHDGRHGEVAGE